MGSLLSSAFIAPDELTGCNTTHFANGTEVVHCLRPFENGDWAWGMIQVLSLMMVYGYVLFYASNMLSEGSELLLLVPSIAGIVGSVVLPILGAVPDGAIMLFSGLGPDAQNQLSVGVGALAGSTIMLLTIPWGAAVMKGSVNLGGDGAADYAHKKTHAPPKSKLTGLGVTPSATIRHNAALMAGTALLYLIIQGPAFQYAKGGPGSSDKKVSSAEHGWALAGLVLSVLAFVVYIVMMVRQSSSSEKQAYLIDQAAIRALDHDSSISIAGIIAPIIAEGRKKNIARAADPMLRQQTLRNLETGREALLDDKAKTQLSHVLRPFFKAFDTDGDGMIDKQELKALLVRLGEKSVTDAVCEEWMSRLDSDGDGHITTAEFTDALLKYIGQKIMYAGPSHRDPSVSVAPPSMSIQEPRASVGGDDEEDEDEEEVPEDLAEMSPEEQQRHIKRRAAMMMSVGTLLVVVFSDPMVDVMSNVGARCQIPPFYIAFVLAPLASNASELLASYSYAGKKTRKTITVALASLEGAACMNNTFCLAIFMALVYFKGLAWKFTAETLSILLVEVIVSLVAMARTQRVAHAIFVLSLYPLAIAFVAALENVAHLD